MVVVITGILSPMTNLAFSRLRTRMRGLARMLASPSVLLRLAVTARLLMPMVRWFRLFRSEIFRPVPPDVLSGDRVRLDGQATPNSSRRLRLTSSISSSSTTSASGTSCSAIRRSARRIASGVSRTMTRLSFSSATTSRALRMVFSVLATCLASALARKKVLTTISWYSLSLAATFG